MKDNKLNAKKGNYTQKSRREAMGWEGNREEKTSEESENLSEKFYI
jgi:hypothetical protein